MEIRDIWLTQSKLNRAGQIPGMIKTLEDDWLPAITLGRLEDGSIQVEDGHHRLTAIWLSGRQKLEPWEYILIESDRWRPRRGKIEILEQWLSLV